MRFLKITGLILIGSIAILFLYANTRTISPAEKLKRISLVTFSLNNALSEELVERMGSNMKQLPGVTACKTNRGIISVVYHPEVINENTIAQRITALVNSTVTIKIFESASGGCPVHGMTSSIARLISSLDLR